MCSRYAVSHRHRHACMNRKDWIQWAEFQHVSLYVRAENIKGGRGASDHKTSWLQLTQARAERMCLILIWPPRECFFLPIKHSEEAVSDHTVLSRDIAWLSQGNLCSFGKVANLHFQAQSVLVNNRGAAVGKEGETAVHTKTAPSNGTGRGGGFPEKPCKRHGLCPSRSDHEHLSLFPGFRNCSFRPFGLCASSIRLHRHCADLFQPVFSRDSLFPLGMTSKTRQLSPLADCFKDHYSSAVYRIATRSMCFI